MMQFCSACKKYTDHVTLEFYESTRDFGDGSLADRRLIQCPECKGKSTIDFAPDKR